MAQPEKRPLGEPLHPEVFRSVEKQRERGMKIVDEMSEGDPELAAEVARDLIGLNPSREASAGIFKYAWDSINNKTVGDPSTREAIRHFFETIREVNKDDPELAGTLFMIMAYDAQTDTIDRFGKMRAEASDDDMEERMMLTDQIAGVISKADALYDFLEGPKRDLIKRYMDPEMEKELSDEERDEAEALLEDEKNRDQLIEEASKVELFTNPAHIVMAEAILNPSEERKKAFESFDSTVFLKPPKIKTEKRMLPTRIPAEVIPDVGGKFFTGRKRRLHQTWMPSVEKVKKYMEETGRVIAPSVAVRNGDNIEYIDLPSDLATEALRVGYRAQRGVISETERQEEIAGIMLDFAKKLNPEQKKLITEPNASIGIELRFSTEVSTTDPELLKRFYEAEREINSEIQEEQKRLKDIENQFDEMLAA